MKETKFNLLNIFNYLFAVLLLLNLTTYSNGIKNKNNSDITIENSQFKLVLNINGTASSLIHKATGEECLMDNIDLPISSITQDVPYDNEIRLSYPAKPKTFNADSLYLEGDNLIITFELTDYEAVISVNTTDDYIGFTLKEMRYKMGKIGIKRKTKIDELVFLQLPIKNRTHFGEWLNVVWDDDIAVNLLATDQYCKIDAQKRKGYKIFQAGGEKEVELENIGAALITTSRSNILDCINRIEHNYGLPLGVESRKSKEYKFSQYTPRGILTLQNIDEHIAFAKKAGLKIMLIYYPSFARNMGHFFWRKEYPNGIEDLKAITKKIKDADLIPGLHTHYNKASIIDPYVTPIPDNRLNLRRIFTLRKTLNVNATTIVVEENPKGCTLDNRRRMLKVGSEIISYENYTTESPYKFLNCKRGVLNTKPNEKEKGTIIGLLDVDTWPDFIRFNQNTDIQNEVAKRIANIYDECGFKFIYFDGAEDVNPPFWYNVGKAQLTLYNQLKTKTIFAEGAQKSHFGWHMLTRGNGFDTFSPEDIKEATRMYPLKEIKQISNDFSSINFGWNNYVAPGKKTIRMDVDYKSKNLEWYTSVVPEEITIGLQPDMLEYITSRAATWNSPICLVGNLADLKSHQRTDDNLEVLRRWEEVRATDYLTKEQKEMLKNENQEHILLINEVDEFELLPYKQITEERSKVRAFIFERENKVWVVYWHISGKGNIELPISSDKLKLYKELGKKITIDVSMNKTMLPVDCRRYIQFDLTYDEVTNLFSMVRLKK